MDRPAGEQIARIVALDGVTTGHSFEVTSERMSFGRGAGNQIVLADPAASRVHCELLEVEGGRHELRDLNSHNGTFVNGIPIRERTLEPGDEIRIGDSTFRYTAVAANDASPRVLLQDAAGPSETVMQLRQEESIYLKPEQALETPARSVRAAAGYGALLHISAAIHARGPIKQVAAEILAGLMRVIPAEEGAVLLYDDPAAEPSFAHGSRRDNGARRVNANGPLVERVLREGIAAAVLHPYPALAAPLICSGAPAGVLYLGCATGRTGFAEMDIQLAAAAAVICGPALDDALELQRLRAANERLRAEIDLAHEMVGESASMRELLRSIGKVAPSDATVLVLGETGTGKELVARAIHRNSRRSRGPFVAISCAALTEALLETELFGHERGAFTGAVTQKKGRFELAGGGTIFLDEVGELPPPIQAKLLRVLQEREFERVGGTRTLRADVRVIAATNRDLRRAMDAGGFREDLFYRLSVVSLRTPPLRERREDIPLLASYFLARFASNVARRVTGVSRSARECLLAYDWPGNVRELQNAMESAVVLGSAEEILPEDLPEHIIDAAAAAPAGNFHAAVKQQKRDAILDSLRRAGGNITAAAAELGLHPNYLHRLIRNLGLREDVRRIAYRATK